MMTLTKKNNDSPSIPCEFCRLTFFIILRLACKCTVRHREQNAVFFSVLNNIFLPFFPIFFFAGKYRLVTPKRNCQFSGIELRTPLSYQAKAPNSWCFRICSNAIVGHVFTQKILFNLGIVCDYYIWRILHCLNQCS